MNAATPNRPTTTAAVAAAQPARAAAQLPTALALGTRMGWPYYVTSTQEQCTFRCGNSVPVHPVLAGGTLTSAAEPRPWLRASPMLLLPGLNPAWAIYDLRHLVPTLREELPLTHPGDVQGLVAMSLRLAFPTARAFLLEATDAALCEAPVLLYASLRRQASARMGGYAQEAAA